MRERIEMVVRWASVVIGVLIIGSCTFAGGSNLVKSPLGGALLGFLGGALVVTILLGWIFAYFLLRRDLKAIQTEIAKLGAGASPAAVAAVESRASSEQHG